MVGAVFIFNFTELFILLQENYHKFNSLFLLMQILHPLRLFFVIGMSAISIIVSMLHIVSNRYIASFAILSIAYSICTSVYLINKMKYYLDAEKMLLWQMSKINHDDIILYRGNRFNRFFTTLVETLYDSGSYVMKANFVNAVYRNIICSGGRFCIVNDNIRDYRLIYDAFKQLADLEANGGPKRRNNLVERIKHTHPMITVYSKTLCWRAFRMLSKNMHGVRISKH